MKNLKEYRGITLITLVVTIIVLIIIAGVSISLILRENGIINKALMGNDEYTKEVAIEKINLKITNAQMNKYAQEQRMPTLEELAIILENDSEIQYVNGAKTSASIFDINFTTATSIYTKLKEYPYEFEIDNKLRLASIDGVKVAEEPSELETLKAQLKAELKNELQAEMQTEIQNKIQTELSNTETDNNPVGTIIAFMGVKSENIPDKYLPCNSNTTYNISEYPKLAALFQSEFGKVNQFGGDGETTFALPNLSGEFLRGVGTNTHKQTVAGVSVTEGGGASLVGTHQASTVLRNIWHYDSSSNWQAGWYSNSSSGINSNLAMGNADRWMVSSTHSRGISSTETIFSNTSNNVGFSTRPTNTSVLYLIKAK